ncbi:MAG TPA: response regulator [Vicinamibacteria bacterium]|nr:response regulator [Vicinamibacteria bacterium]
MTRARPVALLADAHASFRSFVRPFLEDVFVQVHEATTVEEVAQLVHGNPLDVVLLDIGLGGPALARWIKTECPSTRVLLLTGHGEEAYLSATGKTGSDAVLAKPQTRSRLAALLASLLRTTPPGPWDGHERREAGDPEPWRGRERRAPVADRK